MAYTIDRRELLKATGAAVIAGALGAAGAAENPKKRIVGISCSARKGKTTAQAVQLCLDAAREVSADLTTELFDIAELNIPAYLAAGVPLREGDRDDFPALYDKLIDPNIAGIIVGSPVYFGNMSAQCKAFLDRCMSFRKTFAWKNKIVGVVAVGGTRNGGQELTIESIKTGLLGQDVIAVGTGQKSVRIGASLWNQDDSIAADEFGVGTAKDLGRHVAELALKL